MIQIPGTEIQLRTCGATGSIDLYDPRTNGLICFDAKSAALVGGEMKLAASRVYTDKLFDREQLKFLAEQRKRKSLEEERKRVGNLLLKAVYEGSETVRISGFTPKEIIDELRKDYVIEYEPERTDTAGIESGYVIRLEPN